MSKNAEAPGKNTSKKPYLAPRLIAYGDIHEITQASPFPQGNLDGFRTLQTGGRV